MKGDAVDSEHLSEMTEEEYDVNFVRPHLKGFVKIDAKYLIPFLTRRFTQQVVPPGEWSVNFAVKNNYTTRSRTAWVNR